MRNGLRNLSLVLLVGGLVIMIVGAYYVYESKACLYTSPCSIYVPETLAQMQGYLKISQYVEAGGIALASLGLVILVANSVRVRKAWRAVPQVMHSQKLILTASTLFATLLVLGAFQLVGSSQPTYCGGGWGDGDNVCTITLNSGAISHGVTASASSATNATSSFSLVLNNPGAATTISSLTLAGMNLSSPITVWSTSPSAKAPAVDFAASYQASGDNSMAPGGLSTFTFYPVASGSTEIIAVGQTFNYVINFANGQSISGSLIAQ